MLVVVSGLKVVAEAALVSAHRADDSVRAERVCNTHHPHQIILVVLRELFMTNLR